MSLIHFRRAPMTSNDIERIEDLIERIVSVTNSSESRTFYRKAIVQIGLGLSEELLGELKYQMNIQDITSPAKYLTTLLKKEMELNSQRNGDELKGGGNAENLSVIGKSYFSATTADLFEELKPLAPAPFKIAEIQKMPAPYSKNFIPWATMIGPEFFTLSSNKARSDRVELTVRTLDGQTLKVPMIRGRLVADSKADEYGILKPEHGRILGSLEVIWVNQGSRFIAGDNGSFNCYCIVHLRDLAQILGWKSFGGRQMTDLKDKLFNLKSIPYYLEFENTKFSKKGYPFTFLERVELRNIIESGMDKSIAEITFSHQYSYQLLSRRVVARPKEITQIKSEMAFILRLYIESIIYKKPLNEPFKIELSNLIKILNLPRAGWHKYKSLRRSQFSKAIKEMNTMKTADGRLFNVSISDGSNDDDCLLLASLDTQPKKQPVIS